MTVAEQITLTVNNPFPDDGGAISNGSGNWIDLSGNFSVALVAWWTDTEDHPDQAGVIRTLPANWLDIASAQSGNSIIIPRAIPLDYNGDERHPDHYAAYYRLGATWDLSTPGIRIGGASRNATTLVSDKPFQVVSTTTGPPSATDCIDTNTTFTTVDSQGFQLAEVGDIILNTTDSSTATVLAVDTNTLSCTALTGGSDNTFETGDSYEVQRQITLGAAPTTFNLDLISNFLENEIPKTSRAFNSKLNKLSYWNNAGDNDIDSVDIRVGSTSWPTRARVNDLRRWMRHATQIKMDMHDYQDDDDNNLIQTYYGIFADVEKYANSKGMNKMFFWNLGFQVESTVEMPLYS